MTTRIRTTPRHDEGASAVEYGLLVAAIAALIVGVVFLLGGKVSSAFADTCSGIGSGTADRPTTGDVGAGDVLRPPEVLS